MPGPLPSQDTQNPRDRRPKTITDGVTPTAPTWLTSAAKKVFKDACHKSVELGIAGRADRDTLSLYAVQMTRLQELSGKPNKDMREEKLLNDLVASVSSLSRELGLSPGGRARMRITAKADVNLDSFFDVVEEEIKH